MRKEIIAIIISIMIGTICSTWLITNQGRYIQQQAQEIRDLQARVKDLKLYISNMEAASGTPLREDKEVIQKGRIITAPYVVKGKRYVPMSVKEAETYNEQGIASWYGYESGYVTATGETFDPDGLSAAHKYLPLPSYVRVTNLDNKKSIVLKVNDRGPFVAGRIIDLSAGAAKKLGFHKQGIARVLVETIKEG